VPATPTQSIGSASTTTTTSSSAPSEAASGRTALTKGQAIGISVAAVGFVLIAVGIFYALGCIRRRKRKATSRQTQRHSYDFVDDASAQDSEYRHAFDNQKPVGGSNNMAQVMYPSEKRNTN
jgi:uncharacterized protein HemX